MNASPTTFTLDGDYSQKLEIGHWVIDHHTGHVHGQRQIAGQSMTQHLGPVTLTESVQNGVASLGASVQLGPVALPLGHFDLSKPGSHPVNAKLDGGNWFKGTLVVA